MLTTLIEAALRSLVLALIVGVGLRVFRIHNVVSQRCAWAAVLIGCLLMPFVLPFSVRWHVLPVASIPAPSSLDRLPSILAPASTALSIPASSGDTAVVPTTRSQHGNSRPATTSAGRNPTYMPSFNRVQSTVPDAASPQTFPAGAHFTRLSAVLVIYILIAAALLLRLLIGLAVALRLWRSATPIAPGSTAQIDAEFNARFSHRVSTPVTVGSGIILPADYSSWTEEKLRIVLAHER